MVAELGLEHAQCAAGEPDRSVRVAAGTASGYRPEPVPESAAIVRFAIGPPSRSTTETSIFEGSRFVTPPNR